MYSVENIFETSESFGSMHSIIDNTLVSFGEFIEESFKIASNMMQSLKVKLEENSKISEEDKLIFLQHEFEPRRLEISTMEFQASHSCIGYLYSQLDIFLIRIADIAKDLLRKKTSLANYRNKCKKFNKDIIKFKYYLLDILKIDFSSLEKYWVEIENFKKIRNYIVHQNGIKISDEKFLEYVETNPHLRIENNVLIVPKEYLMETSNIIKDFLFKVMHIIFEKSKAK